MIGLIGLMLSLLLLLLLLCCCCCCCRYACCCCHHHQFLRPPLLWTAQPRHNQWQNCGAAARPTNPLTNIGANSSGSGNQQRAFFCVAAAAAGTQTLPPSQQQQKCAAAPGLVCSRTGSSLSVMQDVYDFALSRQVRRELHL